MSTEATFRAAIERLFRRVMLTVGRGRITAVNDAGPVQMTQIKLGAIEVRDNTPRLAEFGFTSNPPAGTDAAVLFIGGDRSNGVIIATGNQQYRLKGLAGGEVALYDAFGQTVWLKKTGIVVNSPMPITVQSGDTLRLTAPTVEIHATTKLKFDCGGNGTDIKPGTRDDYVTGSINTSFPLSPAEIP